jgi:3D (Asp-Asp-Asp) domain-containing protein
MLISRSLRRKLLATLVTMATLVLVYEATAFDSRSVLDPVRRAAPGKLATGSKVEFVATAYCKGQTTASGVQVKAGIAAGDRDLLPEGSVVRVDGVSERHSGIYTVMDTGPKIQGRRIDLYMWSCYEALAFGRRPVTITVLRLGYAPNNSR